MEGTCSCKLIWFQLTTHRYVRVHISKQPYFISKGFFGREIETVYLGNTLLQL